MMSLDIATNADDIDTLIRKLSIVGHLLKAHPYPHRPYYSVEIPRVTALTHNSQSPRAPTRAVTG